MTAAVSLNTAFELVGAVLAIHSAWLASREPVHGVSKAKELWSVLWAMECVAYYDGHGEGWAAVFAGVRCAALMVWCACAITR